MALGQSNTFSTPSASLAISTARTNWNSSIRALLQNFYSDGAPVSTNIEFLGTATAIPDGTLYRSSLTGALYIADSGYSGPDPVFGSNFTRNGIGTRVETSLSAVTLTQYEVGEILFTTDNTRAYIKTGASGTLMDLGTPPVLSITNNMITAGAVTNVELATDSVISTKIQSNAVTKVKMASGTIGELIYYGSGGNVSNLTPRASGNVLTSAGIGSLPTFDTLPGNALGSRTISTSSPSGGSDGDIWYVVSS